MSIVSWQVTAVLLGAMMTVKMKPLPAKQQTHYWRTTKGLKDWKPGILIGLDYGLMRLAKARFERVR